MVVSVVRDLVVTLALNKRPKQKQGMVRLAKQDRRESMGITFMQPRALSHSRYARVTKPLPMMGTAYLSTILENDGHDVSIINRNVERHDSPSIILGKREQRLSGTIGREPPWAPRLLRSTPSAGNGFAPTKTYGTFSTARSREKGW
ncbi:MAG: hypothetical protein NTU41_00610 [Chloroflexi bacterium]|nr:hypothetical protein [Chloroflexota bacterium]